MSVTWGQGQQPSGSPASAHSPPAQGSSTALLPGAFGNQHHHHQQPQPQQAMNPFHTGPPQHQQHHHHHHQLPIPGGIASFSAGSSVGAGISTAATAGNGSVGFNQSAWEVQGANAQPPQQHQPWLAQPQPAQLRQQPQPQQHHHHHQASASAALGHQQHQQHPMPVLSAPAYGSGGGAPTDSMSYQHQHQQVVSIAPQPQQQQQQQQPQQQQQVVLLANGQYAMLQQPPPPNQQQHQQHQQQHMFAAPGSSGQHQHQQAAPHYVQVAAPQQQHQHQHQHHQQQQQPIRISPSSSMSRSQASALGQYSGSMTTPQLVQVTVGGAPSPTSAISPQRTTGLVTISPGHSISSIPGGRASGAPSPGGSTTLAPGSRPLCDTAVWGYAIVDPYHQALQRVPVPPSAVEQTRGVKNYVNDVSLSSTKPCTSIMCVRHVGPDGCPLREGCHNFHVSKDYVEAARACTDPLCCGLHNCYFSREMIRGECAKHIATSKFSVVLEDRSEVDILPTQLAWTIGMEQLSVRGASRVINLRKQVCRLHLEGRCKWTKDCGHVHLCRELHRFLNTFHLPSLVFLLSTEIDPVKLQTKLSEVADFVKSRSCLPLTWHLITSKRAAAVRCMADAGALFTMPMANAASKDLGVDAPAAQVIPESDAATEMLAAAGSLGKNPSAATDLPTEGGDAKNKKADDDDDDQQQQPSPGESPSDLAGGGSAPAEPMMTASGTTPPPPADFGMPLAPEPSGSASV